MISNQSLNSRESLCLRYSKKIPEAIDHGNMRLLKATVLSPSADWRSAPFSEKSLCRREMNRAVQRVNRLPRVRYFEFIMLCACLCISKLRKICLYACQYTGIFISASKINNSARVFSSTVFRKPTRCLSDLQTSSYEFD